MPFFALSLVDARRTSEIIKVANSRSAPTVAKHLPVAIATRSATLIITNGGSASAQEISLSEKQGLHTLGEVSPYRPALCLSATSMSGSKSTSQTITISNTRSISVSLTAASA